VPIDPSIPMNVYGGGGPASPAMTNPLTNLSTIMDIQQKQNALTAFPTNLAIKQAQEQEIRNKLLEFQQGYEARQTAGRIIAGSKNLDEAQQALLSNPQVAAFGLPHIQNLRQLQLTNTQIAGEQQRQLITGADALPKMLIGAAGNPDSLPALVNMWAATQPESIRGQLAGPASALITSLMPQGTMGKPYSAWTEEQRNQYKKNQAALMTQAGVNPSTAQLAFGAPGTTTVQGVPVPTQTDLATGAQTIVGGQLRPGGSAAATPPGGLDPTRLAGNGVPLASALGVSPNLGTSSLTGQPIPNSAETQKKLADAHVEDGKIYGNSQTTLGSLRIMRDDLDTLARVNRGQDASKTNFLTPGPAAELRLGLANVINTVNNMTGTKLTFDPQQIASGESFIKQTQIYGIQTLNTLLGAQREAAATIHNITTKGTPSISNSYLGARIIIGANEAAAQRLIDEHDFRSAWMADPRNAGNLQGADTAFNKAFPATSYMEKVLKEFGLNEHGHFSSPEAVRSAYHRGLLTQGQAEKVIQEQFPNRGRR